MSQPNKVSFPSGMTCEVSNLVTAPEGFVQLNKFDSERYIDMPNVLSFRSYKLSDRKIQELVEFLVSKYEEFLESDTVTSTLLHKAPRDLSYLITTPNRYDKVARKVVRAQYTLVHFREPSIVQFLSSRLDDFDIVFDDQEEVNVNVSNLDLISVKQRPDGTYYRDVKTPVLLEHEWVPVVKVDLLPEDRDREESLGYIRQGIAPSDIISFFGRVPNQFIVKAPGAFPDWVTKDTILKLMGRFVPPTSEYQLLYSDVIETKWQEDSPRYFIVTYHESLGNFYSIPNLIFTTVSKILGRFNLKVGDQSCDIITENVMLGATEKIKELSSNQDLDFIPTSSSSSSSSAPRIAPQFIPTVPLHLRGANYKEPSPQPTTQAARSVSNIKGSALSDISTSVTSTSSPIVRSSVNLVPYPYKPPYYTVGQRNNGVAFKFTIPKPAEPKNPYKIVPLSSPQEEEVEYQTF